MSEKTKKITASNYIEWRKENYKPELVVKEAAKPIQFSKETAT